MAAVIHMVRPTTSKTFNDYVSLHIIPYLESQIKNDTQRIDAVWDNYLEENNLKLLTQRRRGSGPRTRVAIATLKFQNINGTVNSGFLKNENNRKELFQFISTRLT